jgi:hypothetical protein
MTSRGNSAAGVVVTGPQIQPGVIDYTKLAASLQSMFGQGFRNRLINGDMRIAQRGLAANALNPNNPVFGPDRWWAVCPTGATATFGATSVGTPVQGDESALCAIYAATVAGSSGTGAIVQRVENVRQLAGQRVTVAVTMRASVGSPRVGLTVTQNFGTGGSPSAQVFAVSDAQLVAALGSSLATYTYSFDMPSITGKTVGSNEDSYLQFQLNLPNSVTTVIVTQAQMELGPVATPFEVRPVGTELALCQRYYQTYAALDSGGVGTASASWDAICFPLPVPMRASPTQTYTDDQSTAGNVTWRSANGTTLARGVPQGTGTTAAVFSLWDTAATKSFFSVFNIKLSAEL